jgi:hypothetical protein
MVISPSTISVIPLRKFVKAFFFFQKIIKYVILTPVYRTRVISCCIFAFAISFNSGWGLISDSSLEMNTRATIEIIMFGYTIEIIMLVYQSLRG